MRKKGDKVKMTSLSIFSNIVIVKIIHLWHKSVKMITKLLSTLLSFEMLYTKHSVGSSALGQS